MNSKLQEVSWYLRWFASCTIDIRDIPQSYNDTALFSYIISTPTTYELLVLLLESVVP